LFNTGGPGPVYSSPSIRTTLYLARGSTKVRKEIQNLEGRINSLKVLALTLLREVEYLEEHDANDPSGVLNLQDEVHRFEAEMIRSALIRTGGRQRRAARLLGMKTTTLNSKIKRYQIAERKRDESEK
jgi:DNA-binding NtrC family response regulator